MADSCSVRWLAGWLVVVGGKKMCNRFNLKNIKKKKGAAIEVRQSQVEGRQAGSKSDKQAS